MDRDVIERVLGFDDYEMWKKCELLRNIINISIERKEGRGRNVKIIKDLKHDTSSEVRRTIERSCEYYKKLYEENMDKKQQVGSFEIIKYRFENINGEPKILIDMVKVLDTNGQYIKFAKLEKVIDYLEKYPVKFKKL